MDHKVDRSLFFKGDAVTHVKSLSHLNPAKVGEGSQYCELSGCFSWWWFGEGARVHDNFWGLGGPEGTV